MRRMLLATIRPRLSVPVAVMLRFMPVMVLGMLALGALYIALTFSASPREGTAQQSYEPLRLGATTAPSSTAAGALLADGGAQGTSGGGHAPPAVSGAKPSTESALSAWVTTTARPTLREMDGIVQQTRLAAAARDESGLQHACVALRDVTRRAAASPPPTNDPDVTSEWAAAVEHGDQAARDCSASLETGSAALLQQAADGARDAREHVRAAMQEIEPSE